MQIKSFTLGHGRNVFCEVISKSDGGDEMIVISAHPKQDIHVVLQHLLGLLNSRYTETVWIQIFMPSRARVYSTRTVNPAVFSSFSCSPPSSNTASLTFPLYIISMCQSLSRRKQCWRMKKASSIFLSVPALLPFFKT